MDTLELGAVLSDGGADLRLLVDLCPHCITLKGKGTVPKTIPLNLQPS